MSNLGTIYGKRWEVKKNRSIKNNASFTKAPTKTIKTQQAHFTVSMIAFIKLARLKLRNSKNHYAMKSEIWLVAMKATWKQLQKLSTPMTNFDKNAA